MPISRICKGALYSPLHWWRDARGGDQPVWWTRWAARALTWICGGGGYQRIQVTGRVLRARPLEEKIAAVQQRGKVVLRV